MEKTIIDYFSFHQNPSIRYLFLTGYEALSLTDPRVKKVMEEVRSSPLVAFLLGTLTENGEIPFHAYSKWRGSFWTLLQMVDLGYPPGDSMLVPLMEQSHTWLLDPSFLKRVLQINGRWRRCALQEGGSVLADVHFGFVTSKTEELVEQLLKWQWPDGGWNCDKKPLASHSSFYETWIPLRALNAYEQVSRDARVRLSVEKAAEVFLRHRLFKKSTGEDIILPNFTQLAFPAYWHYDVLVGLLLMDEIGRLSDPRCKDALDWLESRQLPGRGFPADVKYFTTSVKAASGVSPVNWGALNIRKQNDYITVRSLGILKKAGRL